MDSSAIGRYILPKVVLLNAILLTCIRRSWGPLPWLYPPEVIKRVRVVDVWLIYFSYIDHASFYQSERCLALNCHGEVDGAFYSLAGLNRSHTSTELAL
jgi:hypothetical protein